MGKLHPLPLSAIDREEKLLNVIIETPKGFRNKFRYEEKLGLFSLRKVLPAGAVFPYDFGFVAGTRAEDGDPLDILLLMDTPAFPGCLVQTRLIGVLEAEQTEDGKTIRNDRLVGVPVESHDHQHLKSLKQLEKGLRDELAHFFESYNAARGKTFRLLGCRGPKRAWRVLKQSIQPVKAVKK